MSIVEDDASASVDVDASTTSVGVSDVVFVTRSVVRYYIPVQFGVIIVTDGSESDTVEKKPSTLICCLSVN